MEHIRRNSYRGVWREALAVIVAGRGFAELAHANPVGPTIDNDTARFSTQGNLLSVTNSPAAIVNWPGFPIRQNKIGRCFQQSTTSAIRELRQAIVVMGWRWGSA